MLFLTSSFNFYGRHCDVAEQQGLKINIRGCDRKLCDILVNSTLLASLEHKGVLTHKQCDKVSRETGSKQKNCKFLHYLRDIDTDKCTDLMDSLEENGQKHVVNFIHSNGGM